MNLRTNMEVTMKRMYQQQRKWSNLRINSSNQYFRRKIGYLINYKEEYKIKVMIPYDFV